LPFLKFDSLCYGFPFDKAIAISEPVNESASKVNAVDIDEILGVLSHYYAIPKNLFKDEFHEKPKLMFGTGLSLYKLETSRKEDEYFITSFGSLQQKTL
jgi:hypothetical protein